MVGDAVSFSQRLLIESRHRIALSHVAVARSLFLVTRHRRIGGASDSNTTEPQRCHHRDLLRFPGRGTYPEICAERDRFAAEFHDHLVSPVVRSTAR